MNSLTKETKLTIFYIVVAFTFSVLMRMIWIYQFSDAQSFKYAGQFMINTNDGYYWAEGARDILAGFHQPNDLSAVDFAASQLTAFFAKIVPFSFESIILYMPVFLSSLIVIPIILIAKSIKNLELGLIAALLASIAWSYYNRTMVGYYDTDMLNIVLPMFLLWSIIWAINTHEDKYLLFTALDILAYRWWYPQSYSLEFAFFALILLYALVWDRKNIYNYKLLAIMMFAMLNISELYRLPLVFALYFAFKKKSFDKYIYYILGVSIALFFLSGGFEPIWQQLKAYIFNGSVSKSNEGLQLHFFTVMQTVREAGHIPFETFANRISGHTSLFIVSIVGYLYLLYKQRIMLLSLPLVGLGFLAMVGGLRFTVYAVPILALGIAFLITEIASFMPSVKLKYLAMIAATLAILYPNYKHIDGYRVPTVFNANEVATLDALKKIASREDYAVAWWDYGYPIRYYADVKTLIDGGKHGGNDNFPVSFILTHPQKEAAKLARLDVEYTEKEFKNRDKNLTYSSTIEHMTKEYGFNDTNRFLESLKTESKLPKKTRNIYLYLPYKMLSIYPTVTLFSNLNLMNGTKYARPFFFMSRNFKEVQDKIVLGNNIYIEKKTMSLVVGNRQMALRRFVKTGYTKDMHFTKQVQNINFSGNLSLIYMSAYHTFLVVDEKTYNSLYIQLMVLENYNRSLFEQVISNPYAKIYKLKI